MPHLRIERRQIAGGDIGRIADHQIEAAAERHAEIAGDEGRTIRKPEPPRVAARHGKRGRAGIGADAEGGWQLGKKRQHNGAADPARSAEDLTESYQSFGDDPWIAAFGGALEPADRVPAVDDMGGVQPPVR